MPAGVDLYAAGLPRDAPADRAYREYVQFTDAPSAPQRDHTVPGDFYELPLAIQWVLATDAAVGTRTPSLTLFNANGVQAWQIPAAAALGPATTWSLVWAVDVTALSAIANLLVMPLPPQVLFPEERLRLILSGADAGDTFFTPTMTCLRIPTGPRETEATAVPTPLLL